MKTSNPKSRQNSTAARTATASEWLKPAGTCLSLLLLLVGLKYVWSLAGLPLGDDWRRELIQAFGLLGGAVGVFGYAWGWFDHRSKNVEIPVATFYAVSGVLALGIFVFILHYGMFHIGGYDHGYMVDVGWRLMKGQQMYTDFPCTTPVSFVLGSKFALEWFGNNWRSFVIIMGLFAVVSFLWTAFLLDKLLGRHWTTVLFAAAMQIWSPMVACFWTYNSTSDFSGLLFAMSAMYWLRRPKDNLALASYGASLLLLATMKPNVAGVSILGISAVMFFSTPHRWKMVAISAVAFVMFLGFLAVNHVSFAGMITSYLSVTHRGASLVPFLHDLNPFEGCMALLELLSLLLPAVMIISRGREGLRSPMWWLPPLAMAVGYILFFFNRESKPLGEATIFLPILLALIIGYRSLRSLSAWIAVVALLSAVYGFVTNSEQKLVDMPPVLIAALLLAAEMRFGTASEPGPILQISRAWQRYFCLVCVVLSAVGFAQAIARDRVRSIGPMFEYDNSHTITEGFFKGVRCGRILDEVLKDVDDVIRKNPSASVWFGPRMQWGYAAYNKPSPTKESVQWDLAMFDASKEEFYFNNFLNNRSQILICFKNDLSGYSQEKIQKILQYYDVDQSYPALTVLRLKR